MVDGVRGAKGFSIRKLEEPVEEHWVSPARMHHLSSVMSDNVEPGMLAKNFASQLHTATTSGRNMAI